jgi:anti-anti-sigma factor
MIKSGHFDRRLVRFYKRERVMLKVHIRSLGSVAVLCLQGQIVNGETAILSNVFESLADTDTVILDLARVSIVDAHGLGEMLKLREQAEAKGIRFELMNVPRLINRVLEISRLNSVFQIISRLEYLPNVSHSRRTSVAA